MVLWGKNYTKRELMKYIGDITQACGVRQSVLADGPGRGMRVFDVNTGGGLFFTVLPDRGMDIGECRFNNVPLGFISKTGYVAPSLCEYPGNGFLRGFTGGLLTTCGYTHMGAACADNGVELGLHGRATALVSDLTSVDCFWDGDDYLMKIKGTMREVSFFGENIHMRREITVKAGENAIHINDTVINFGYETQPLMLLYHFNFGYPLAGPGSAVETSGCKKIVPRDDTAAAGLDGCKAFEESIHKYAEQVFRHILTGDEKGEAFAGIYNKNMDISARIYFNKNELPYLNHWKQMGEGDYVCGLEPGTYLTIGRAKARESGALQTIEPGEERNFNLNIIAGNYTQ